MKESLEVGETKIKEISSAIIKRNCFSQRTKILRFMLRMCDGLGKEEMRENNDQVAQKNRTCKGRQSRDEEKGTCRGRWNCDEEKGHTFCGNCEWNLLFPTLTKFYFKFPKHFCVGLHCIKNNFFSNSLPCVIVI